MSIENQLVEKIRNFCIIAHIDHGKSTLADRLLEMTGTVSKREMKDQLLDQMDLERERGITIKLQPVRMEFGGYILNLIDTPGHVDFSYEVSRSLACCEGALLVVDSTQGIEAQTLANAMMAMEHNLTLIPVINKIDLPNADKEKTSAELQKVFGFKEEEMVYVSGKTGEGVENLLSEIIKRIPPPRKSHISELRALIFDSTYDKHRGVITFVRVFDGELNINDSIKLLGSKVEAKALEVGYFHPKMLPEARLVAGEVGYIVTALRDVSLAGVGDTVSTLRSAIVEPLSGYKKVKPMVYASIFPITGDLYPELKGAMEKLKLNDAALEYTPEHIPSIGFGFRTGFLGMLHMEIVQERLQREYGLDVVLTAPSVAYEVTTSRGEIVLVHNPSTLPDPSLISEIREPWMKVTILTPVQYIGGVMEIVTKKRGENSDMVYLTPERVEMRFEIPLASLIVDFYDQLKSATSGYASLNYEFVAMRPGDLVKLDILVAGEVVEPLASIVHRSHSHIIGKELVERLKTLIPKQQFEIALQASIGGKIIARETISAFRKDVTGYLYGGDVTRKMKLLKKQKQGKKRMKKIGKVDIPQEAFFAVLKQ